MPWSLFLLISDQRIRETHLRWNGDVCHSLILGETIKVYLTHDTWYTIYCYSFSAFLFSLFLSLSVFPSHWALRLFITDFHAIFLVKLNQILIKLKDCVRFYLKINRCLSLLHPMKQFPANFALTVWLTCQCFLYFLFFFFSFIFQ